MVAISKARLEEVQSEAAESGYEHGFGDGLSEGRESAYDAAYEEGVSAGWDEADEYYEGIMTFAREDAAASEQGWREDCARNARNADYYHEALVRWRYIAARRLSVGFFLGVGLTVAVFLLK